MHLVSRPRDLRRGLRILRWAGRIVSSSYFGLGDDWELQSRRKKWWRTLLKFPSNLPYSSRTSCSRGVRDSVVTEGSWEMEGCVLGGVVSIVDWFVCAELIGFGSHLQLSWANCISILGQAEGSLFGVVQKRRQSQIRRGVHTWTPKRPIQNVGLFLCLPAIKRLWHKVTDPSMRLYAFCCQRMTSPIPQRT